MKWMFIRAFEVSSTAPLQPFALADILSIGLGRSQSTLLPPSIMHHQTNSPFPQLLSSPTFHRGVGKVAKTVHRIRHGTPMEEMGGTKLEREQECALLLHRHIY